LVEASIDPEDRKLLHVKKRVFDVWVSRLTELSQQPTIAVATARFLLLLLL
jgi:hypothetical protein